MGLRSFTVILVSVVVILLAASCGGTGSNVDTPALDSGGSLAQTTGSDGLSGLPSIPLDSSADRASSAAAPGDPGAPPPSEEGSIIVLGKDYMQMAYGTVQGAALLLESPAAPAEGDASGSTPDLAYALYKVPGLLGKRPLSLNIECTPGGLGRHYFVGVADYTNAKWHWSGPVSLPEFQLDLRGINRQWITNLGNAYFILVCPAGMSATHLQTTVSYGAPLPGDPPGFPYHLVASDGQLAEAIGLHWDGAEGVAGYEVFRKPARADTSWEKIAQTTETHYVDQPRPDYKLFFYRVRSVNSIGRSAWSNVDSGFAGGGEDPCVICGEVARINGNPVGGVRVMLAGMGEEALRVTGPDGKFRFGDLPPGRYLVVPFKPELDFAPQYAVADLRDKKLEELHFNAIPEAPFHRIWGFAYEYVPATEGGVPELLPMAGLIIEARKTDQPDTPITVQTNEDGFYHFEDLPEGVYLVHAVKDGYGFFPPVHEVVVTGMNRPDRRDFIGHPLPADGGGGGTDPGGQP